MTPSPSARRFDARLRLYTTLLRAARAFDFSDVLTLVSLGFIFVGLTLPSAAFAVTGALILPLTPIWTSIRIMLRGR